MAQVFDHRAFIHVGADVHVGRHQHHVPADEAALARDRRRHHAEAAFAELLGRVVAELGRDLVEEVEPAGLHHLVVAQAEGDQHRLLDPLVDHPLAVLLLGHAQRAGVQAGDDLFHRVADLGRGGGGRQAGAVLEGGVDDRLQSVHVGILSQRVLQKSMMRPAASTHSCVSATSAMRTKPAPGLTPLASRARIAAGQDRHIIFSLQTAGELGVRDRCAHPVVETGVGQCHRQVRLQHRRDAGELVAVEAAVLLDVLLVVPGRDRGRLHRRVERAAVVGAVEQEILRGSSRRRRRSRSACRARSSAWTGWRTSPRCGNPCAPGARPLRGRRSAWRRRRSRSRSSTRRRRSRSRSGRTARTASSIRRASTAGRWGCPASTRRRAARPCQVASSMAPKSEPKSFSGRLLMKIGSALASRAAPS